MLPFPQLVQYGNTVTHELVLDYVQTQNFLAVLTSTGKLYFSGALNTTMGLPSTAPTLVRSDVKSIHGGTNYGCITIRTVTDQWFYIGYNTYTSVQSGGTNYGTWQEVTSLYSGFDLNLLKQIQILGFDTYVHLTDGRLYACGKNYNGNFGNGTTTGSNTFVLLRSDVVELTGGDTNSYGSTSCLVVTTAGNLLACGSNIGNGTGNNISTWTTMVTAGVSNISQQKISSAAGCFRYQKGGSWYIFGTLNGFRGGTGATSNSTGATSYPRFYDNFTGILETSAVTPQFAIYQNQVYVVGAAAYNANGQMGLGDTTAHTAAFVLVSALPLCSKVTSYNGYSVALTQAGQLYVCGNSAKWGSTGSVLTFTQLSLPQGG